VNVECELPPAAPARVDALRFAQITSNLLDNAVKYNRPSGARAHRAVLLRPAWRLSVANTGPEIAPEHRARLFERFFRADRSTEDTGQGLGLSLARELAHAHGGESDAGRSDGEWTEFTVTLPKAGPEPRQCN
jgi:signal transduction histidine kinase